MYIHVLPVYLICNFYGFDLNFISNELVESCRIGKSYHIFFIYYTLKSNKISSFEFHEHVQFLDRNQSTGSSKRGTNVVEEQSQYQVVGDFV